MHSSIIGTDIAVGGIQGTIKDSNLRILNRRFYTGLCKGRRCCKNNVAAAVNSSLNVVINILLCCIVIIKGCTLMLEVVKSKKIMTLDYFTAL